MERKVDGRLNIGWGMATTSAKLTLSGTGAGCCPSASRGVLHSILDTGGRSCRRGVEAGFVVTTMMLMMMMVVLVMMIMMMVMAMMMIMMTMMMLLMKVIMKWW